MDVLVCLVPLGRCNSRLVNVDDVDFADSRPDGWRDFGGTGENTMIPYPNGVWLDAKGHFKRVNRGDLPNVAVFVRNGELAVVCEPFR